MELQGQVYAYFKILKMRQGSKEARKIPWQVEWGNWDRQLKKLIEQFAAK